MEGSFKNTSTDANAEAYTSISWSGAHDTHQGSALALPAGENFLAADFSRSGTDLLIETPSGGQFVVAGYFTFSAPPALETVDGAILNADLVVQLAGPLAPGMTAQAADPTLSNLGEPIGQINESEGTVFVTHADGVQATLSVGDSIYQGDVLETGPKSNAGVVFADDTIFTLSEDGRMVMDEMVYDPGAPEDGIFNAQVVQGVFSFVSGKVAKTSPDGMMIATPTNTIGIRGSTVLGEAAPEGAANKITLINDVNGNVGELVITNGAGTMVLNQAGASTTVFSASAPPTPFVIMSPQAIQQSYGSTLTNLVKSVAQKAQADTKEMARQSQKADQEAEQAQEEAAKAEEEAVQADQEAQQAEADAQASAAEADAVKAEAEAIAAEAEAMKSAAQAEGDVEMAAKAAELEAQAAEMEAQAAEAEAQAEAQAQVAAQAQAQAEAQAVEAQAQADIAVQAEQQAVEAQVQAEQQAQYSTMAESAAVTQEQVFTQFVETGTVDPNMVVGAAAIEVIQTATIAEAQAQEQAQADAVDAAAQAAADQVIAQGGTQEEAAAAGFAAAKEQAIADGATPEEIAAAEQAYNDAIAAGMSPEEAMQAAGAAAGQLAQDQQFVDGQAPVDGQMALNANQAGDLPQDPNAPVQDPNAPHDPNMDPNAQMSPQEADALAQAAYDEAIAAGMSPAEADLAVQAQFASMANTVIGDPIGGPAPGTVMADGTVVPGGPGIFGPNTGQTPGTVMGDGTVLPGGLGDYGNPGDFNMGGFGMDPYGMGGMDPYGMGGMDMFGMGGFGMDPMMGMYDMFGPDPMMGMYDMYGMDPMMGMNDIYDPFGYDPMMGADVFYDPYAGGDQYVTNEFALTVFAGSVGETLYGDGANTNFLFSYGQISGSYFVNDQGGNNQISFSNLNDVKLKVTVSATDSLSGNIQLWSGFTASEANTTVATVQFNNISQYMLADGVPPDLASNTFQNFQSTDILVFPSLGINEVGYVIAGTSGADAITVSGTENHLVFGKGDGDTFTITNTGNIIAIGGITTTDNIDDGSGGGTSGDLVPDAGLNVFSYSTIGESLNVNLFGGGYAGGEATVSGKTTTTLHHDLWDVSSFIASDHATGDTISINGGYYNTVNAGAGGDTVNVEVSLLSKPTTFDGGADADTIVVKAFNGGTWDLSTTTATISNFETYTVDLSSSASGVTMTGFAAAHSMTGSNFDDNLTGGANVDTISGGSGADVLVGGGGADQLSGGNGADIFSYTATTQGTDTISDFVSGTDKFNFLTSAFNGANVSGTLNTLNFVSGAGAVALDTDDYFYYDSTAKTLSYDLNGSTNGAADAVVIAGFATDVGLQATDIVIV